MAIGTLGVAESYYKRVGTGSSAPVRLSGSSNPNAEAGQNLMQDLRNIPSPFFLPGATENIVSSGKLCYLTFNTDDSFQNALVKAGLKYVQALANKQINIFFRIQDMDMSQRTLKQVKQTFDGIYVDVYGGGLSRISLSGITKIWSNCLAGQVPINDEVDIINKLMIVMSNMRGSVFNYHDGIVARKWSVIPDTFSTSRNTGNNNLETYKISFIGSSYNQKFRNIDLAGESLQRFGGPTASFNTVNVI